MQYFIKKLEETIKSCWEKSALNDYKSKAITYGELARKIEKLHIVWRTAGLKEGEKISLNVRSNANWVILLNASKLDSKSIDELLAMDEPMLQHRFYQETQHILTSVLTSFRMTFIDIESFS